MHPDDSDLQLRVLRNPKSNGEPLLEPAHPDCRRFKAVTSLPRPDQLDVVSASEQFIDHEADSARDAVDFRRIGFGYDRNAER
jgi:hypothetical protein